MNPFLRYLADKNSAHRHTLMITRPCGLRRAGNNRLCFDEFLICSSSDVSVSVGGLV